MKILVKLNTASSDTGPFLVYTNLNSYQAPAYGPYTKTQLTSGVTITVPNVTTGVRIRSNSKCVNELFLTLPTTTTTTSTTTTSTTSSTTLPPEEFVINVTAITSFTFSALEVNDSFVVDWGDGNTQSFVSGTQINLNKTYSPAFTGVITIRTANLTNVKRLEILNNSDIVPRIIGNPATPSTFTVYILGSELAKLDGLNQLRLNAGVLLSNANTTNFTSPTLTWIESYSAQVGGTIANIPTGGTRLILGNYTTVSGNLSSLTSSPYISISIQGSNTISGNISSLPATTQSFVLFGDNTITGNLSGIPGSFTNGGTSLLTTVNIQGDNTVSGNIRELPINNLVLLSLNGENGQTFGGNTVSGTVDINGLGVTDTRVWNPNIVTIQLIGENTVSGSLSTFTNCTALLRLVLRGESTTNPLSGSTISGALTDLPKNNLPALGDNNILFDLSLSGKMAVTGALSDLTNFIVIRFLYLDGVNTISGDISDLYTNTIYSLRIAGQSTVNAYTTNKTWPATMTKFSLTPTALPTNRLIAADLGRMLIDLDTANWEKFAGSIDADISASGQRTAALALPGVTAAYNSLDAKIVTAGIGLFTINNYV
jgi:hypothetical protein